MRVAHDAERATSVRLHVMGLTCPCLPSVWPCTCGKCETGRTLIHHINKARVRKDEGGHP